MPWPVRNCDYAIVEAYRIDEGKCNRGMQIIEQMHAFTNHNRTNHQVQLVQQAITQQRANQPWATWYLDVFTGLSLEFFHGRRKTAAQLGSGKPVELLRRMGNQVLR